MALCKLASSFGMVTILSVFSAVACSSVDADPEASRPATSAAALTAQNRLDTCQRDPRVMAGLVSREICAGADIFFRETFGGNGRTCGTCHSAGRNFTIDHDFIATLPPTDPLFVPEQNPDLAQLEVPDLRAQGGVLENLDGFEDPTNKFARPQASS